MRSPRMTPLRGALLGLTHPHSAALLQTLENLPEVAGVSLWENEPNAARTTGLPKSRKVEFVSRDLDAILSRDDLDFAVVCVRHDQAAAVSRRVVDAGKHLLAEKPVGINPAEVRELQRAANRAGLMASVLYPRRLHPATQAAQKLVARGALGPLLTMEARFLATQVRFRNPQSWLFKKSRAGGGILTWLGCHYLDLLYTISSDPIAAVSASLARRSGQKIDVEDSVALALQFRSGAVGTLHLGYTLAFSGAGYLNPTGNDGYLSCNGHLGRIVWPVMSEPRLHVERPGRKPVRSQAFAERPTSSYAGACGEDFVRQFLQALRGRAELPATLADALRVAYVTDAAYRSARSGRRTSVQQVMSD